MKTPYNSEEKFNIDDEDDLVARLKHLEYEREDLVMELAAIDDEILGLEMAIIECNR